MPGIRLISLAGGAQDNAIPKEAEAVFLAEAPASLEAVRARFEAETRAAFAEKEPGLNFTLASIPPERRRALSGEDTRKAVSLLNDYPNGVQAMSADIPGLVQTSLNLGILRLEEGRMELSSSVRSSVAAEKDALCARLETLAAQ